MTRASSSTLELPASDRVSIRRSILIRAGIIILATLIAYLPVIVDGGFIWDDDDYVTGNALLLDLDGLARIWIPRQTHQYYPLVFSSFWIEHKLWGFDPHGYHIVNVLLHIVNALLVWRVFFVLRVPGAWMIGAVFALHPVHVESVAWITERKNVLSAGLYLLSALSYLRFDSMQFDERRSTRDSLGWYGLSLVLFAMALLSKSVTCSLPAALILAMLWQRKRLTATRLAWLVPMFIIGLLLALHTAHIERINVGAVGPDFQFTFMQRILIACNALLFYPWKIIWPHPLIFIYERWPIHEPTMAMWLAIPVVVLVVIACIVAYVRGWRGIPLSLAFFAGTIFPALGFFNVYPMRYSFVADHFQYLASIGVIAAIVAPLARHAMRFRASSILGWAALGLLALLTWREGPEYRNPRELWIHTIRDNPRAWMAQNNFGNVLMAEGKPGEAIPYFQASIAEHPDHYEAIANMAIALGRLDRYEEAIPYWQQVLSHHRTQPIDHVGMAFALYKIGDTQGAIQHYETALERLPLHREARLQLGIIYAQQGRKDEAAQQFAAFIGQIDSTNPTARNYLAVQAEQSGNWLEAMEHYRAALVGATDPANRAVIAVRLARLLATCPEESMRDYELATALCRQVLTEGGGNDPIVLDILAQSLFGQGLIEDAIGAAESAIPPARDAGLDQLADEISQRLEHYRRNRLPGG